MIMPYESIQPFFTAASGGKKWLDRFISVLDRLAFELAQVQVVIETAFLQQLLVAALLHDFAVVDHHHVVGIADGAQAVGNHKTGSALHQAQQRFLDARLGARVHAAGGLIQDQDGRVGQDGAGDRQQLALSLAQVAGAFCEQGLVTLRQLADKVIGIRQFGRVDDLLVAWRPDRP